MAHIKDFSSLTLVIALAFSIAIPISTTAHAATSTKTQELEFGQLLMVGISGTKVSPLTTKKLKDLRPGGIILFSRNISSAEQLAKLTFDLQREAKMLGLPPLFIAIDQEGGSVTRLKSWPPLPSAAAIGRSGSEDLSFKISFFSGQMMRTLGLNMNLAPVLDLADPYRPSFLGSRAIHHDPGVVERIGASSLAGYQAAGILAIAKHFPGHGAAAGDSHKILPTSGLLTPSKLQQHLEPFRQTMSQSVLPGIMVAHVAYPQLDPSGRPATFSPQILSGLLREQMGFSGLIITDDVEMQGARTLKSADLRSIAAVSAGADIVMVAWNRHSQYAALEGLKRAVLRGQLSEDRIRQSLSRISRAKAQLEFSALPTRAELRALVFHRELYAAIDQVLIQNIRQSFFSTPALGRDIVVLTDDPVFSTGLKQATRGEGLIVESISPNSATDLTRALSAYPKHVSLFLQLSNRQNLQMLFQIPQSLRNRIVVVSSELPSRLKNAGGFQQAVLSYSKHPKFGELFGQELRRLLISQRRPSSQEKSEGR